MSPTLANLLKATAANASDFAADHRTLLLTLLTCTVTLALLVLYRLILYPRYFSPLRTLPGPPLGDPLLGQFPAIMQGEAGIPQRAWVKAYGGAVRAVGPIGIERVIFCRAEALAKILVGDWIDYPRPDFLKSVLGLVAGHGLLTVTGNEHKQMRRKMNPAFSIPNLMAQTDMYYDPIECMVNLMGEQIDAENKGEGKILLMYEWMSKVTLDIICETAFGYRTDSLRNPHNELAEAYENLISLQTGSNISRFVAILSIPGVPRFLGSSYAYEHRHWFEKLEFLAPISVLVDSMHRIKKISKAMLEEKMRDAEVVEMEDTAAKWDIMSLLVRGRKAEGEGEYVMDDKAMMDQVLTFLGAGHETTASGLAWTLWLLAQDRESQRKLRDEVRAVLAENERPEYRTLRDLQWLDCVVMESLRVMPPVPMTFRKAAKTDYVEGHLIPKGTIIYIPIRVVNTWKDIWGEDAEEFRPDRWLKLGKDGKGNMSFLSFIAGPHGCIGKTMAIIEMKAVLASLIAHFEFRPAYGGQVARPTAAVTMKPQDEMPLEVRRVVEIE